MIRSHNRQGQALSLIKYKELKNREKLFKNLKKLLIRD